LDGAPVGAPARAPVPPASRAHAHALLHGAAAAPCPLAAPADRPDDSRRGSRLRLRLGLALLQVLPGGLQEKPAPGADGAGVGPVDRLAYAFFASADPWRLAMNDLAVSTATAASRQ